MLEIRRSSPDKGARLQAEDYKLNQLRIDRAYIDFSIDDFLGPTLTIGLNKNSTKVILDDDGKKECEFYFEFEGIDHYGDFVREQKQNYPGQNARNDNLESFLTKTKVDAIIRKDGLRYPRDLSDEEMRREMTKNPPVGFIVSREKK